MPEPELHRSQVGEPREEREPVLVSACLLGMNCRYDGDSNLDSPLIEQLAAERAVAVPFCPEERGGLSTPRPAAWIERAGAGAVLDGSSSVVTGEGVDVTEAFVNGAQAALTACEENGIRRAFLKERSPSCGVCQTHVNGQLVDGPGVTAECLKRAGIEVRGVEGRRE